MPKFPAQFKRTPPGNRDHGSQFNRPGTPSPGQTWAPRRPPTIAESTNEILKQVRLIPGASDVVLDTDLRYKNDGTPYSQQRTPEDPGVVVRFKRFAKPFAVPCDRFRSIEANLRAVALMLEASRLMERYGFDIFAEDFQGYKALPPVGTTAGHDLEPETPAHEVLGVAPDAPREVVEAAYRALALKAHPDRPGGSTQAFQRLAKAKDTLLAGRAA